MGKTPLTAITYAWESLYVRFAIAIMAQQHLIDIRATQSIRATIGAGARLSIMAVLNFIRILFLLSPFFLSLCPKLHAQTRQAPIPQSTTVFLIRHHLVKARNLALSSL
jgi:hypothetical protein